MDPWPPARVRALRPSKPALDPWRHLGTLAERERWIDGRVVDSLTVFLAGAECPFTCLFCDLWRHTLDGATPPGAIPAQLRLALAQATEPPPAQVKLYNASNFFDQRAVPTVDEPELLEILAPFERVVVENHPRLVGDRCLAFADALSGHLQVAMGLETIHPEVLPRLGKGMTLADFDDAARTLVAAGIGLRVFVLLGAPFVPPATSVEWTVRSVAHALDQGAEHVAIIPVRAGNGALDALRRASEWSPPTLDQVEQVVDGVRDLGGGVITVDLWDLEEDAATNGRVDRLRRLNLQVP